jgi:hypothetical protein
MLISTVGSPVTVTGSENVIVNSIFSPAVQ